MSDSYVTYLADFRDLRMELAVIDKDGRANGHRDWQLFVVADQLLVVAKVGLVGDNLQGRAREVISTGLPSFRFPVLMTGP